MRVLKIYVINHLNCNNLNNLRPNYIFPDSGIHVFNHLSVIGTVKFDLPFEPLSVPLSDYSGKPGCNECDRTHSGAIVACTLVLGTPSRLHAGRAADGSGYICANRRGSNDRCGTAEDRFQFSDRLTVHARG